MDNRIVPNTIIVVNPFAKARVAVVAFIAFAEVEQAAETAFWAEFEEWANSYSTKFASYDEDREPGSHPLCTWDTIVLSVAAGRAKPSDVLNLRIIRPSQLQAA